MKTSALLRKLLKLHKEVKRSLAYKYGYIVTSPEYPDSEHIAFTYEDAIEWMQCYQGSHMYFKGVLLCRNQLIFDQLYQANLSRG